MMREQLIVALIATGICSVTGYIFIGRPYLERRSLHVAEKEAEMLMRAREKPISAAAASQSAQQETGS